LPFRPCIADFRAVDVAGSSPFAGRLFASGYLEAGSMAETIPPRADTASQRFPLTGGEVVAAIYRIVFRGCGDNDVFANAAIRWTDFVAPVLISLALDLIYETASEPEMRRAVSTSGRAALIIYGILVGGILFRLLVATGGPRLRRSGALR
jgi:hypothetical protein